MKIYHINYAKLLESFFMLCVSVCARVLSQTEQIAESHYGSDSEFVSHMQALVGFIYWIIRLFIAEA